MSLCFGIAIILIFPNSCPNRSSRFKGDIVEVTIVHVQVKPENIDDFIEATRLNHGASIQESGNLRFDVLQLKEDPSRFVLYEAYQSLADAAAHKETEHYQRWRESVADWMAQPREGVPYEGLFPR